ncbi:ZinT/AdcA family metal-binding protein [Anaerococcus sp. AGMB00486]|uniref:ZinT/AdcA family metal-binding protein n=1 Tax=Anaerococcus faecalis TaxID=2742993 RepID=A0ABX2NC98_9FIRM|nr:ZinT/AdcA family metal-binding protein [Anaerococcus faecalis]NVF12164.1 ZinT/AdcA family metal-binding protein [Anaerococcus faecalis]
MNNKKKFALIAALSLGLVMTACQNNTSKDNPSNEPSVTQSSKKEDKSSTSKEDNKSNKDKDEKEGEKKTEVSLSDWEGEWNDMGRYLDKKEIQPAFKTLAENEKIDENEAKENYLKKRHCDFGGLRIKGDEVEFLNDFPDKNPELKGKGVYKFVGKQEVEHGGYKMEWDIFEAKNEDAPYKYLLMMPIHGEESLTHFHMRYGNDKDKLLQEEGWYPTFVKPSTTDQQIIDEITE